MHYCAIKSTIDVDSVYLRNKKSKPVSLFCSASLLVLLRSRHFRRTPNRPHARTRNAPHRREKLARMAVPLSLGLLGLLPNRLAVPPDDTAFCPFFLLMNSRISSPLQQQIVAEFLCTSKKEGRNPTSASRVPNERPWNENKNPTDQQQ
jgi:hypothetical protein